MRSISLLLDPEVVDEIDRQRGDVPRVRWIRRVINDALQEGQQNGHTGDSLAGRAEVADQ